MYYVQTVICSLISPYRFMWISEPLEKDKLELLWPKEESDLVGPCLSLSERSGPSI